MRADRGASTQAALAYQAERVCGASGGSSLKVAASGVSGVCDGVSCLKVALPLLWSVFEVRDGDRMEHVGRGAARA